MVSSFHSQQILRTPIEGIIKRAAPLKTAGYIHSGFIPRLEPGLRLLRSSKYIKALDPAEISTISLNLMNRIVYKVDEQLTQSSQQHNKAIDQLFATAKKSLTAFSFSFLGYMKKVFAASLILASTIQVSPVALKRAANVITGTVAAAVVAGPQLMARASIAKKYTSLTANQRLGTTPVYYVANSRGNAFLQEDMQAGRPDQKCVVYFLSYEDAADYLEEMAQSNALNAHEFHVVTISMEKVVDNIATRKQSRKLGRYPMDMVYRLQPSSKQCENAEVVAGKGDRARGKAALKGVSIPMFSAPGLVIQRAGTNELVTPYYFALEDLQEDWQRMLTSTSSSSSVDGNTAAKKVAPAAPKVVVHDFTEVMCLSQGISKQLVAGQGT